MDIVTEGRRQSFGFVRQRREGCSATHVLVVFLEALFEVRGLGIHFDVEHGGFEAPDAAETPTGGYDVGEKVDFDLVGGLKIVDVLVQHFCELLGVLALEDQGFGGQAVTEGVHRAGGESLGRFRAAGFGAVDSGGFGFG